MILVRFFDMNKRPSRNYIRQLAIHAEQFKQKGLSILVQVAKVDEKALNEWIEKSNIRFAFGTIEGDVEKTRFV